MTKDGKSIEMENGTGIQRRGTKEERRRRSLVWYVLPAVRFLIGYGAVTGFNDHNLLEILKL
jgi:hypothetical protein